MISISNGKLDESYDDENHYFPCYCTHSDHLLTATIWTDEVDPPDFELSVLMAHWLGCFGRFKAMLCYWFKRYDHSDKQLALTQQSQLTFVSLRTHDLIRLASVCDKYLALKGIPVSNEELIDPIIIKSEDEPSHELVVISEDIFCDGQVFTLTIYPRLAEKPYLKRLLIGLKYLFSGTGRMGLHLSMRLSDKEVSNLSNLCRHLNNNLKQTD